VRVGNDAAAQLQLGTYGDLLATAWLWIDDGHHLDAASATRLAEATDFLTLIWRRQDAGFWELPNDRHYTGSKLSSWEALHNASRLAERGDLPAQAAERWRQAAAEARDFVQGSCWSSSRNSYMAYTGADGLDAVVLLASRMGFHEADDPRLRSTVAAIRSELSAGGPLLFRTTELRGREGAFVACSFWLVEALARQGDVEEAGTLMEDLIGQANDVGLYSEEIDPATGEFLGNMPQALSHMALINAAVQLKRAGMPSGR
jgi:GH15 family glucan-1,4-alpha-glucosidase